MCCLLGSTFAMILFNCLLVWMDKHCFHRSKNKPLFSQLPAPSTSTYSSMSAPSWSPATVSEFVRGTWRTSSFVTSTPYAVPVDVFFLTTLMASGGGSVTQPASLEGHHHSSSDAGPSQQHSQSLLAQMQRIVTAFFRSIAAPTEHMNHQTGQPEVILPPAPLRGPQALLHCVYPYLRGGLLSRAAGEFPAPMCFPLSRGNAHLLQRADKHYTVVEKSDGVRTLIVVKGLPASPRWSLLLDTGRGPHTAGAVELTLMDVAVLEQQRLQLLQGESDEAGPFELLLVASSVTNEAPGTHSTCTLLLNQHPEAESEPGTYTLRITTTTTTTGHGHAATAHGTASDAAGGSTAETLHLAASRVTDVTLRRGVGWRWCSFLFDRGMDAVHMLTDELPMAEISSALGHGDPDHQEHVTEAIFDAELLMPLAKGNGLPARPRLAVFDLLGITTTAGSLSSSALSTQFPQLKGIGEWAQTPLATRHAVAHFILFGQASREGENSEGSSGLLKALVPVPFLSLSRMPMCTPEAGGTYANSRDTRASEEGSVAVPAPIATFSRCPSSAVACFSPSVEVFLKHMTPPSELATRLLSRMECVFNGPLPQRTAAESAMKSNSNVITATGLLAMEAHSPTQALAATSSQLCRVIFDRTNFNDGLIFTPDSFPLSAGSRDDQLKWKWPDLLTVDFFVVPVAPDDHGASRHMPRGGHHPHSSRGKGEGHFGYRVESEAAEPIGTNAATVFARLSFFFRKKMSALQMKKRRTQDAVEVAQHCEIGRYLLLNPIGLHVPGTGTVFECCWDRAVAQWQLVKRRDDKREANSITTVLSVLESYCENITLSDLVTTILRHGTVKKEQVPQPVSTLPSSVAASTTGSGSAPSALPEAWFIVRAVIERGRIQVKLQWQVSIVPIDSANRKPQFRQVNHRDARDCFGLGEHCPRDDADSDRGDTSEDDEDSRRCDDDEDDVNAEERGLDAKPAGRDANAMAADTVDETAPSTSSKPVQRLPPRRVRDQAVGPPSRLVGKLLLQVANDGGCTGWSDTTARCQFHPKTGRWRVVGFGTSENKKGTMAHFVQRHIEAIMAATYQRSSTVAGHTDRPVAAAAPSDDSGARETVHHPVGAGSDDVVPSASTPFVTDLSLSDSHYRHRTIELSSRDRQRSPLTQYHNVLKQALLRRGHLLAKAQIMMVVRGSSRQDPQRHPQPSATDDDEFVTAVMSHADEDTAHVPPRPITATTDSDTPPPFVFDLCCGRGGDLHKHVNLGVKRLLMVDSCFEAVAEAAARYSTTNGLSVNTVEQKHAGIPAQFVVADCFRLASLDTIAAAAGKVIAYESRKANNNSRPGGTVPPPKEGVTGRGGGFGRGTFGGPRGGGGLRPTVQPPTKSAMEGTQPPAAPPPPPDPIRGCCTLASCQFSIHYACDERSRLMETFSLVSAMLQRGGVFVGTTVDSETIETRRAASTTGRFGNGIYSVDFGHPRAVARKEQLLKASGCNTTAAEFSGSAGRLPFGEPYVMNFEAAVVNEVEYVVPWAQFLDVARSAGFRLLESENLWKFSKESAVAKQEIADWTRMLATVGRKKRRRIGTDVNPRGGADGEGDDDGGGEFDGLFLTEEESHACSLYRMFVFVKE